MRRLLRFVIGFFVLSAAMSAAGAAIGRIIRGDTTEDADEFRLFAFWNGSAWRSTATSLTSGRAMAVLGGVDLDLTAAKLDSEGAELSLTVALGGIRVLVPAEWRIHVTENVAGGGVETHLPDQEVLASDAPVLTVDAMTRAGGILITNGTTAT